MLLTFIQDITTASALIKSAHTLSVQLKKPLAVAVENPIIVNDSQSTLLAEYPEITILNQSVNYENLADVCESIEASFLLIQVQKSSNSFIKKGLKSCRNLRIPYLFFYAEFNVIDIRKVLVPIGFLVEEQEKAQFASAFGRFCSSHSELLLANDYGTRATRNMEKISNLLDKFSLDYQISNAKKDSFKVDKEAIVKAQKENFDLVIISASRDYGLDDIIFGPKEYHIVRQSQVPVLLINPRGDLYALCD